MSLDWHRDRDEGAGRSYRVAVFVTVFVRLWRFRTRLTLLLYPRIPGERVHELDRGFYNFSLFELRQWEDHFVIL